mgnify:CR=1 FL=1
MDVKMVAQTILESVGGKKNVVSLVYCATRLRFTLKDESWIDEERITSLSAVSGSFHTGGQYQIILGLGTVKSVFDELNPKIGRASCRERV